MAQERIEHDCERVLITQTFVALGYRFPAPGQSIYLDRNPCAGVTRIDYVDADGNTQTLDASIYRFDPARRMVELAGDAWPTVTSKPTGNAVQCFFTAGYGSSGNNVPAALLQGMLLLIENYFYGVDIWDSYTFQINPYKRTRYP
jgi:uncharacterized phiE125 gp8 family phage protein